MNPQDKPTPTTIFEATAALLEPAIAGAAHDAAHVPMVRAVQTLLRGLDSGKQEHIEQALHQLGAPMGGTDELYQRVGHMTRSLHDSLRDFRDSLDRGNLTMSSTNIPDAADKLEAVIRMTFEAAEKTLNQTEHQAVIITAAQQALMGFEAKLQDGSIPPEAREWLQNYVHEERARLQALDNATSEVLMAQSFQDLTGQALRKVIKLVVGLEDNLVGLIQLFGGHLPGHEPHPAPVVTEAAPAAEEGKTSGLEQDDVDSVLSSFGF